MVRSPCYPHQGGAISVLSTPKCGADKAYLIYIVLSKKIPLVQPENNHRPVNFPLLQHFPETRNVSHGNKPENGNISTFFLLAQGQNIQLGNQR